MIINSPVFKKTNTLKNTVMRTKRSRKPRGTGKRIRRSQICLKVIFFNTSKGNLKSPKPIQDGAFLIPGAGGRSRTDMSISSLDFESSASTSFTTPAGSMLDTLDSRLRQVIRDDSLLAMWPLRV